MRIKGLHSCVDTRSLASHLSFMLLCTPPLASAATTIWPATVTPSIPFLADQPVELGVKFRSDVDGTISGVRFYKGLGSTGTHTGSLWTSIGTRLATGTFTNESASGWQELIFSQPVSISANTTYIASYHANNGYAVSFNYFSSKGADNGPLHALKSGVDGPNGVFAYGAGGQFPSNPPPIQNLWFSVPTGQNYWVDVIFTSAVSATTVTTAPAGLSIVVDGVTYKSPQTFQWGKGSKHTISTTASQPASAGTQYVWSNWSDSGALSHSIVAAAPTATYVATFGTQYYLSTNASPAEGGSIAPPSGWYAANTRISATATPNSTYIFAGFTGALTGPTSPQSFTLTAPATVTAAFAPAKVAIIVTTAPPGLSITADGATCTTPCSFQWTPASQHTISSSAAIPGSVAGTQYTFTAWSDGGSRTHSITVPSSPATYTAQFTAQYYLTTSVNPAGAGAVTPQSGWYDSGSPVSLNATSASGYTFTGFSGDVTSTTTPLTISITRPTKVTAAFMSTPLTGTVYTVCNAGCTHATINAAIAAARCGDTILVSAAQPHYGGDGVQNGNNPVILRGNKGCTLDNPITIETSAYTALPPAGTRITPNYADGAKRIVALVQNSGSGPIMRAELGDQACPGTGPCPASGYIIRGLEFCCAANYSDFIQIGGRGLGYGDLLIKTVADLPVDIAFERVIARVDPLKNTRRIFELDGRNVSVKDSWIEGAYDTSSSDSQTIASWYGQNVSIINNLIKGTTEVIALSGAPSPIIQPGNGAIKWDPSTVTDMAVPTNVEVAYNDVTVDELWRAKKWSAGAAVPYGQVMLPSLGGSIVLRAINSGVTGSAEPTWSSVVVGATISDGTVTWVRTDTVPQVKNLLESKESDTLTIHHNFFHNVWPQGQQGYAFTFTSSPYAGPAQRVRNTIVEHNLIRDVGNGLNSAGMDTWEDPNGYAGILGGNIFPDSSPYVFTAANNTLALTINGTPITITIPPGSYTWNGIVTTLNSLLAPGPGLVCQADYGFIIRAMPAGDGGNCGETGRSRGFGTTLTIGNGTANAVLKLTAGAHAEACYNPRSLTFYGCGNLESLIVRHNLWQRMNVAPNFAGVPYMFLIGNRAKQFQFVHNTVTDSDGSRNPNTYSPATMFNSGYPASNSVIRDNLLPLPNIDNWSGIPFYIEGPDGSAGFLAINWILCNTTQNSLSFTESQCPAGVFSHNWLPDAVLYSAPTMTSVHDQNTGKGYHPSDNWNYPLSSIQFADAANGDVSLLSPTAFLRAGTDGLDIGADATQLPLMKSFTISTMDQTAKISFQVTDPIKSIPCVIRVSPDSSFSTIIPDLDPSAFVRPDSTDSPNNISGADGTRTMLLGRNVPLAANTTYYYYVGCGGVSRSGTFRTQAPLVNP